MPAIITNDVRVFTANQFLNAFQNTKYDAWLTGQSYVSGDVVYNGNYKYIATSSGTSGATAPTHTSGTVSDGGVDWLFVEVFTNTANFQNNMYLAIGRNEAWDNPGVGDETPIAPVDDHTTQYPNIANVISAKRIESSDVKMAIRRYDWDVSGTTVYSQYDPDVESFNYPTPFYVLADNKVYKCLSNNGGVASITQPTGTSVDPFVTAGDGYVWKYMFSVDSGDAVQFLSTNYIPVEKKLNDDGTQQWNVQQNAKKGSLSTINVTAGGSGYTTATVTVDAPVGGGTTATANAVIEGGAITAIQLSNVGEGYYGIPNVSISGDGTGATAVAVLAPKDGHGSNPVTELDARYAIVASRFEDTEGGYFPITGENDFRQIQILVDPVDVNGNPATATRYIGADHDDWDGNETSGKSELMKGSGTTIYIENIEPVTRQTGQIEDLKVVLKF